MVALERFTLCRRGYFLIDASLCLYLPSPPSLVENSQLASRSAPGCMLCVNFCVLSRKTDVLGGKLLDIFERGYFFRTHRMDEVPMIYIPFVVVRSAVRISLNPTQSPIGYVSTTERQSVPKVWKGPSEGHARQQRRFQVAVRHFV